MCLTVKNRRKPWLPFVRVHKWIEVCHTINTFKTPYRGADIKPGWLVAAKFCENGCTDTPFWAPSPNEYEIGGGAIHVCVNKRGKRICDPEYSIPYGSRSPYQYVPCWAWRKDFIANGKMSDAAYKRVFFTKWALRKAYKKCLRAMK